jgi:hypothetical protein
VSNRAAHCPGKNDDLRGPKCDAEDGGGHAVVGFEEQAFCAVVAEVDFLVLPDNEERAQDGGSVLAQVPYG